MKALVVTALLAAPAVARADCWWPGKSDSTEQLDGEEEAEGCNAGGGAVAGGLAVVGAAALAVGRRRRK